MPIHPSSSGALCGYSLLGRSGASRPLLIAGPPDAAAHKAERSSDPSIGEARVPSVLRVTVPILSYHKVAEIPSYARHRCNYVRPSQFAAQLAFLRRAGFSSITFAEYEAYRLAGATLPRRPVLVTFDDGYRSNLHSAFPLLREYGFVATVFVVTGRVGQTNRWDADEIQEPLLTFDDIRRLPAMGIDVQSHTVTHPRLTEIPENQAYEELVASRRWLESAVQRPVSTIAYPWGDSNASVHQLARKAGYRSGVILRRRTNFARTPLLELRRIGVNETTSLARFAWDLLRLQWRGD